MTLPAILLAIAALLTVVGLVQPVAVRAKLPHNVVLAMVGVAIGALSTFLLYTSLTDAFNYAAEMILHLPLSSAVFIYIFLPVLLFQAAFTLDVNRMIEDTAPILLMAVVAVVVATVVVGAALAPVSGMPVVVCLMLGAIVATTDPSAVVAIFRDLGAPGRLSRLVEGESLLNDAAAIAIFGILLNLLVSGAEPDIGAAVWFFLYAFAGGAAVGVAAARLVLAAMPLMRDLRTAQVTLTVALPYVAYILSDQYLGVSGVVAAVTAGLVMSALGRRRIAPDTWNFLQEMWEQIAFWAGSLVFVLAAILVPRLMVDITLFDLGLLLVLVAATLAARAAVLFGLLPLLTTVGLSQAVSTPYKVVILWGGLRGAVTLALALSVTENVVLPEDIKAFVAVLATGYVLFTLFVKGLTLRPLIRLLGLDRLSAVDLALRRQVLALSLGNVMDAVKDTAREHEIAPTVQRAATRTYEARIAEVMARSEEEPAIADRDRVNIGLVALATREAELVLDHQRQRTVSPRIAELLLVRIGRLAEGARQGGRLEYQRAARALIDFRPTFRFAHQLHRRLRWDRPLMGQLADRFEMLLVSALVLRQLETFAERKLVPLLGRRIADLLKDIVGSRIDATNKALDALRLQYPDYAEALERRFLQQTALRRERMEYRALFDERLIGQELYSSLLHDVDAVQEALKERPQLDLGLDTRDLMRRFEMFRELDEESLTLIGRLFAGRFAVPGERIIRRGDPGDSVYFISSGAVEVVLPDRKVRLGSGDFFGEMALLSGRRRNADVTALSYCRLLILRAADFRRFLRIHPTLRARFESVVRARHQMNEDDPAPVPPDIPDMMKGSSKG
ncbi:cation:proton antiporter [Azospirillum halopraeferens]|uniref:cation:proton antiporter n=1 Tax=Azospirillum halopraeferens TaxID=34010 RepID=UPI0003F62FD6|nr:cation:proton antiporter [Azospirillum halopraeferens]